MSPTVVGKQTLQSHAALSALDLLRALAAMTVMTTHLRGAYFTDYGQIANPSAGAYAFFALTRVAHEAVMVFFVLSGLLVGGRVLERVRAGTFDLTDYAIDRSTRILLPLIPAVLLTVSVSLWLGEPASLLQTLAAMAGLNGVIADTLTKNPSLWSLAYEIWFYVVAGALGYLFSGGRRRILAATFVALSALAFVKLGELQYLLFWVLGALTALFVSVKPAGLLGAAGAVLSLTGILLYEFGTDSQAGGLHLSVPPAVAEGLLCIGLCAVLPYACGGLSRRLHVAAPVLTFLGAFSYSLYLVHEPLIALMQRGAARIAVVDLATLGGMALRWLLLIALALAFYFLFERHTGLARRLLRRQTQRRTVAAA